MHVAQGFELQLCRQQQSSACRGFRVSAVLGRADRRAAGWTESEEVEVILRRADRRAAEQMGGRQGGQGVEERSA
mgnify:CR=1 FL=1